MDDNLNVVQPDIQESKSSFLSEFVNKIKGMKGSKAFTGLFGLLLLVGALAVGMEVFKDQTAFNQKAFNTGSVVTSDSCGFVEVTTIDNSCSKISAPSTNPVSTYSVVYSFKNVTPKTREVAITKKTNFCVEPYGQDKVGVTEKVCDSSSLSSVDYITLAPGQTKNVTLDRSSDSVVACGSYQSALYIDSIDGDTSCHGKELNNLASRSVCQTGMSCSGTNLTNSYCDNISAYSLDWANHYSPSELTQLRAGNSIYLCAVGVTGQGAFDAARFTINGVTVGPSTPPVTRPGSTNAYEFCEQYTIPVGTLKFDITAQMRLAGTTIWK